MTFQRTKYNSSINFLVYLQDKLDAYAATLESAFKDSSSEVPIVMGQTYIAYDDELYHRVRALSQEGRKVVYPSQISLIAPFSFLLKHDILAPVAQSVARPIADPSIVSLIPAWSHAFVEIDHENFSWVILLLSLIEKGLQAKVCA